MKEQYKFLIEYCRDDYLISLGRELWNRIAIKLIENVIKNPLFLKKDITNLNPLLWGQNDNNFYLGLAKLFLSFLNQNNPPVLLINMAEHARKIIVAELCKIHNSLNVTRTPAENLELRVHFFATSNETRSHAATNTSATNQQLKILDDLDNLLLVELRKIATRCRSVEEELNNPKLGLAQDNELLLAIFAVIRINDTAPHKLLLQPTEEATGKNFLYKWIDAFNALSSNLLFNEVSDSVKKILPQSTTPISSIDMLDPKRKGLLPLLHALDLLLERKLITSAIIDDLVSFMSKHLYEIPTYTFISMNIMFKIAECFTQRMKEILKPEENGITILTNGDNFTKQCVDYLISIIKKFVSGDNEFNFEDTKKKLTDSLIPAVNRWQNDIYQIKTIVYLFHYIIINTGILKRHPIFSSVEETYKKLGDLEKRIDIIYDFYEIFLGIINRTLEEPDSLLNLIKDLFKSINTVNNNVSHLLKIIEFIEGLNKQEEEFTTTDLKKNIDLIFITINSELSSINLLLNNGDSLFSGHEHELAVLRLFREYYATLETYVFEMISTTEQTLNNFENHDVSDESIIELKLKDGTIVEFTEFEKGKTLEEILEVNINRNILLGKIISRLNQPEIREKIAEAIFEDLRDSKIKINDIDPEQKLLQDINLDKQENGVNIYIANHQTLLDNLKKIEYSQTCIAYINWLLHNQEVLLPASMIEIYAIDLKIHVKLWQRSGGSWEKKSIGDTAPTSSVVNILKNDDGSGTYTEIVPLDIEPEEEEQQDNEMEIGEKSMEMKEDETNEMEDEERKTLDNF